MSNPVILEVRSDHIIVGFYFDHFNLESQRTVIHDGVTYFREGLEAIDIRDAGTYCSCRKYTIKDMTNDLR